MHQERQNRGCADIRGSTGGVTEWGGTKGARLQNLEGAGPCLEVDAGWDGMPGGMPGGMQARDE